MSDFPYLGLRPFKRDESDIFRGRNNFVTELSEKLANHHLKPEDAISTLRSELRGDLEKSYQILEKILPENHNLLIIFDQFEELLRHLVTVDLRMVWCKAILSSSELIWN